MKKEKKKEVKTQVTIMLEPSIIEDITKIAKKVGLSRSELMRNLLLSGYDDAKGLDNLGLLKLYGKGRDLAEKIKNAIGKGSVKVSEDGKIVFKK